MAEPAQRLPSDSAVPASGTVYSDDEVKVLIGHLKAIWAGDYSISPEAESSLSAAVGKVAKRLRNRTLKDLNGVVDLSISANETAIFSASTLHNLRQADDFAQSIASAAEEMRASISGVRQLSGNIDDVAQSSRQSTREGVAAARELSNAMERINSSVTDTSDRMQELHRFSREISRVADSIGEIAFQTNLLALNASVEAARAGDAGKGFAVVASAVKNLSEQTADSTNVINNVVRELTEEMTAIESVNTRNRDAVSAGNEAIQGVEERMNDIAHSVERVSTDVSEMNTILTEQETAAQHVVSGVNGIVDETAKSVGAVERIVDSMNNVEKLISAQIARLAELEVPNKVVKLAKSDHVIWKKRLANMIAGKEGLKAEELADHHSCRLGKWYDAVTDRRYTANPAYQALQDPHRRVHQHGIAAVEAYNAGRVDEALAEIAKVETASQDVLRLLGDLEG